MDVEPTLVGVAFRDVVCRELDFSVRSLVVRGLNIEQLSL